MLTKAVNAILAITVTLAAQPPALSEALWWDASYKARREVTVYVPDLNLPGDDAAVISFYTGGHAKPDGSDVRIIMRGKEIPYRLYGMGPGDVATLAFRVERGVRDYCVYFGNETAAAPRYDWQPHRGLVLETRHYSGGDPKNLANMWQIWNSAKPFYGAGAVDRVWHGQNMFGPSDRFVSLYTGWLMCPSNGDYVFATTSDDASFLLVDDKPVVAWPGFHGPVADARHNGTVALKAGMHEFQYLHVNAGGTTCAVAAWAQPGDRGFEVIPESAFAPLSRAVVGPLEQVGQRIAPDFNCDIAGEALLSKNEEVYAVKVAFADATRAASNAVYWDFGDGQTGSGASVSHVYLASGLYPVTMRIGATGDAPRTTNRIEVHQHWGWQTTKEIDEIQSYFPEVSGYNLDTLDLASCMNLLTLAEEQGSMDFLRRTACAIISRKGADASALGAARRTLRTAFGPSRLATDEKVLAAYLNAFRTASGDSKAVLTMGLSDIMLENGREKEARTIAEEALAGKINDAGLRRRLYIICADAARYDGDASAAENALRAASEEHIELTVLQETVMGGALAFKVEDLIARKEFVEAEETLDMWDWEKPLEKSEGYSAYLRARLYDGQGRRARVLKELNAICECSPESAYAPKALLLAGRIYSSQGNREAAKAAFGRILTSYRTSPEAEQARQVLSASGR